MKKIFLVIMLAASGLAQADYREYRHGGHRDVRVQQVANADIIFPLVIGGIFGAVIANSNRPEPIIVQQQPVFVQQQPVIIQQSPQLCTDWKEIQYPDGKIYRERTCSQ